jgi:hypothetical protein
MTVDTKTLNRGRSKHTRRHKPKRGRSGPIGLFGDKSASFKCRHCHNYVNAEPFVSGVQNRNHCPYCLWSRHLDLYKAGDRLAACKGQMEPVGLTLKRTRKKYVGPASGELMLIHRCVECGKVSINRIAADDAPEALFEVFQASLEAEIQVVATWVANGIQALIASDTELVRARLFGSSNLGNIPWDDFLNAEPLLEFFDFH